MFHRHLLVLTIGLTLAPASAGCSDVETTDEALSAPTLLPEPGQYTAGTELRLATDAPGASVYYTLDGAAPDTSAIAYVQPIVLRRAVTVRAIAALGGRVSPVVGGRYTIEGDEVPEVRLEVHFHRPPDWATTINLYSWDTCPALPAIAWPGVPMRDEGQDWYVYVLEGASWANVIFNDGDHQTADLVRGESGWFADGAWYAERPDLTTDTCAGGCGNHATCRAGACGCDTGYEGDARVGCTLEPNGCEPPCGAHAACLDGACGCDDGFEGDPATGCSAVDPGCEAGCGEGGHCEGTVCVCDEGLEGDPEVLCAPAASTCTPACGSHARCEGEVCRCEAGWEGDPVAGCEPVLALCADGECGANATCEALGLNLDERPTACRCRHGFRGDPSVGCTAVELEPLGDFRQETIYFVLTARWYDGDPDNNFYNRDRYDPTDPQWRGDFKGLIEKLDYIVDLGFSAIWITPPIENRSGLDYHGYHGYDWNRIDPRLESVGATYQDFIDAAHAHGLKVVQDVVVNHSSQYGIRGQVFIDHLPIKYYVEQGHTPGALDHGPYQGNLGCTTCANRDDNDNPVAPAWFRERHQSDPEGLVPLVDPLSSVSVPTAGYNPGRFFGIDANTLDPTWYHLQGFMAGGDWENGAALQAKHLAGDAIDLATERQNVKDYLNEAIFGYLDMGVDAIRVDTVKHVERSNLLEDYVDVWKAHRPGLFVFGENLVKGIGWQNPPEDIRPYYYTWNARGEPSGFSVLDFSLMSVFRDSVANGNYDKIAGEVLNTSFYSDATQIVTFFQNHDIGPDNDWKYRFNHEMWKAAATYNLLWTVRGIPCLYYGEEIEFMKGAPQDIADQSMLVRDTGRAYFGDHLTAGRIGETQAHPLYQHIKRLNQIRRAVPALQKGQLSQVDGGGNNLSFKRDWMNGASYAVVGLAIGSGQHFDVGGVRNGHYVDAVTGRTADVGDGTLRFDVADNSAGIWVLDGPGKIGQDGMFLR